MKPKRCPDCGVGIHRMSKRCRPCAGIARRTPHGCLGCGKRIPTSQRRCRPCHLEFIHVETPPCVDCGTTEKGVDSLRCDACYRVDQKSANAAPCSECGGASWTSGLCKPCYRRRERMSKGHRCRRCGVHVANGSKSCTACRNPNRACIEEGCEKRVSAKDRCATHYERYRARRKGSKCVDCGVMVLKASKRCRPCFARHRWGGGKPQEEPQEETHDARIERLRRELDEYLSSG